MMIEEEVNILTNSIIIREFLILYEKQVSFNDDEDDFLKWVKTKFLNSKFQIDFKYSNVT